MIEHYELYKGLLILSIHIYELTKSISTQKQNFVIISFRYFFFNFEINCEKILFMFKAFIFGIKITKYKYRKKNKAG